MLTTPPTRQDAGSGDLPVCLPKASAWEVRKPAQAACS